MKIYLGFEYLMTQDLREELLLDWRQLDLEQGHVLDGLIIDRSFLILPYN
jgi:hypothetical protein